MTEPSKLTAADLVQLAYKVPPIRPEAPVLTFGLTYDMTTHRLTGYGVIYPNLDPEQRLDTMLHGSFYFNEALPPANFPAVVTITGYPYPDNPLGKITPESNVEIHMRLDTPLKKGFCHFSYYIKGKWHHIESEPVSAINLETLLPLA